MNPKEEFILEVAKITSDDLIKTIDDIKANPDVPSLEYAIRIMQKLAISKTLIELMG